MEKNKDEHIGNNEVSNNRKSIIKPIMTLMPKFSNFCKKDIFLKPRLWGIIFLFLGLYCSYLSYIEYNNQAKQRVKIPNNSKETLELLEKESNFSDIVKLLKFDDFWPKEYFDINITDKRISYWRNDSIIAKLEYKNVKNNNTLKNFNDEESLSSFKNFPPITNLKDLVEKKYIDDIETANLDESVTSLCLLYNALAGHRKSFVLLGRNKKEDNWKHYDISDFPKYYIKIDGEKDKNLYDLVNHYASNIESNPDIIPPLNEAIMNVIDSLSVKSISYDYRDELIWSGEDSIIANINNPPYDSTKLNESVCGWVIPNSDKEKLIRASEYYKLDGNILFIQSDSTFSKLNELKWNDRIPENNLIYCLCGLFLFIGFLFIGFSFVCPKIKVLLHKANLKVFMKSRVVPPSQLENKSADDDLGTEIESLLNLINLAETRACEIFEKIKKNDDNINTIKERTIKSFKESNAYNEIINRTKKDAVTEYRNSCEYQELEINANKWKELVDCTDVNQILDILRRIQESKKSFQIPQSLDLENIYSEARDKTEEEKDQIEDILSHIDENTGSKLQDAFSTILQNDKYANDVRDSYDNVVTLVQKYCTRNEYKLMESKDLNLWERLAVMLWSLKFTNELFGVFKKNNFNPDVLSKTIDTHKDDIMQINALRIFRKYFNDPNAHEGELANLRERENRDYFDELEQKYQEEMTPSEYYNTCITLLDKIFDKSKIEEKFSRSMKKHLVDEFANRSQETMDQGEYLSLLVAMGFHMYDYVRYLNGSNIVFCPNLQFVLSDMNKDKLGDDAKFRPNDYQYSSDYYNRVYAWLKNVGIEHLLALVKDKLLLP